MMKISIIPNTTIYLELNSLPRSKTHFKTNSKREALKVSYKPPRDPMAT